MSALEGSIFEGKYYIEKMVGRGGTGTVFRATQIKTDEIVAVKILHKELITDPVAVERFRCEIRTALAIQHPNVINMIDHGSTSDNNLFMVMEYLEGVSLRKIIEKEKTLSAHKCSMVMEQICAGVAAAHSKKIIHRDLKPDNIVVVNSPDTLTVKVCDFSIAKQDSDTAGKLTHEGMVVGTPRYMSPEQVEGKVLDARSDIYSLGIILYEMLTGQVPFFGTTPAVIFLKHLHNPPRSLREIIPDIPPAVEQVTFKALAKRPDERQQSALELAMQLQEAVRSESRNDLSENDKNLMAKREGLMDKLKFWK